MVKALIASVKKTVKIVASVKNTVKDIFVPPATSKQDLVSYARRRISRDANHVGYDEAEAIHDMKLVGMQEMRAVTVFTVKRAALKDKMKAELTGKRIDEDVVDAVTQGIDSTLHYTNTFEDFSVDASGAGKIFKATVMLKPDRDDPESSQVAMAISGAKFDVAKEVETYEEEEIPDYKEVEEIQMVPMSGLFGIGTYQKPMVVRKLQLMGTRKKRTPIFREKTFTKAKVEAVKKFLERKTCTQVMELHDSTDGES